MSTEQNGSTQRTPPTDRDEEGEPELLSIGRLVLVIWPGYGVLFFSLWVSWKLRSAPAVMTVATLAAGLAGVLGGVGVLKAKSPRMLFEARTNRSKPSKKKTKNRNQDTKKGGAHSEIATVLREPSEGRIA